MKLLYHKRKRFFLAFYFLLLSFGCYCQLLLGLGVGFASNHLQTDISNQSYSELKNGSGIGTNILLNYRANNRFELQTGIGSIAKNYSINRIASYRGVFENFKNTYLQIPLLVKINTLQRRKFYLTLDIGLYGGYWSKSKIKGVTPNIYNSFNDSLLNGQTVQSIRLSDYSTNYTFSKKIDNRLELGWSPGITLNYNPKKFFQLFISAVYYIALSDQQKNYSQQQIPKHNRTFESSVGCLVQLKNIFQKSEKKSNEILSSIDKCHDTFLMQKGSATISSK